jgi:hypothetical protein
MKKSTTIILCLVINVIFTQHIFFANKAKNIIN